jgi:hypothetical protein
MEKKANIREALLRHLRSFTDGTYVDADAGPMSARSAHEDAEGLLLQLLGDDEVATAWREAAEGWWYS